MFQGCFQYWIWLFGFVQHLSSNMVGIGIVGGHGDFFSIELLHTKSPTFTSSMRRLRSFPPKSLEWDTHGIYCSTGCTGSQ